MAGPQAERGPGPWPHVWRARGSAIAVRTTRRASSRLYCTQGNWQMGGRPRSGRSAQLKLREAQGAQPHHGQPRNSRGHAV
jgi:hypothetical protein